MCGPDFAGVIADQDMGFAVVRFRYGAQRAARGKELWHRPAAALPGTPRMPFEFRRFFGHGEELYQGRSDFLWTTFREV